MIMKTMVLFIGLLFLLGIVFVGSVNCKSDDANPAAPGQTGANPGQIKSQTIQAKVPSALIWGWRVWRIGSISRPTTSPGTARVDHPSTAKDIATARSLLSESSIQLQVCL